MNERLREAAQAVVNGVEPDDDFDGDFIEYLVSFEVIDALRAALASSAAPPDGDRPPLPPETIAYDKGVMDGYLAAKKDYSPGGMYAEAAQAAISDFLLLYNGVMTEEQLHSFVRERFGFAASSAAPRPEGLDVLPANLVLRPARRGPRRGIHPAYIVTEPYPGWPNGNGVGVIGVYPENDRGIANANAIAAAIVALVNDARAHLSDTGETPDGAS